MKDYFTEQNISKKELNQLVKIAQQCLLSLEDRADLETHWSDSEDFFDASIWGFKAAMIAAYNLGKQSR